MMATTIQSINSEMMLKNISFIQAAFTAAAGKEGFEKAVEILIRKAKIEMPETVQDALEQLKDQLLCKSFETVEQVLDFLEEEEKKYRVC